MTFDDVINEISKSYTLNKVREDKFEIVLDNLITGYNFMYVIVHEYNEKIVVSDMAHTIESIDYDTEVIKETCKQFNVMYDNYLIYAEYQNNNSVKNVIDCITKIAEINDKNIENYNKVVEEVSNTYSVAQKRTNSCLIKTGLTSNYAFITLSLKSGKIIVSEMAHPLNINYDKEAVKEICNQFNVSYNDNKVSTEYKNNDSIKNVIDCLAKIVETFQNK